MQSSSYFIDDNGGLWESNSYRLRSELNGLASGELFSEYVLKNLGFVRLSQQPKSVAVRFRPETVSRLAFVRLLHWLTDEKPDRVLLSTYTDGSWQHAMIGKNARAFDAVMPHGTRFREQIVPEDAASYDIQWHPDALAGLSSAAGPLRIAKEL